MGRRILDRVCGLELGGLLRQWSTGMGHGDRFYLSDIDPDRAGPGGLVRDREPHPQNGVSLWDARAGDLIFGTRQANKDNQIAGGLVVDIDPS